MPYIVCDHSTSTVESWIDLRNQGNRRCVVKRQWSVQGRSKACSSSPCHSPNLGICKQGIALSANYCICRLCSYTDSFKHGKPFGRSLVESESKMEKSQPELLALQPGRMITAFCETENVGTDFVTGQSEERSRGRTITQCRRRRSSWSGSPLSGDTGQGQRVPAGEARKGATGKEYVEGTASRDAAALRRAAACGG